MKHSPSGSENAAPVSVEPTAGADTGKSWAGLAAAAWPYAVVLAVGIFVLLPKLGVFGFWDPWEPKYAESAREMIEKDSYIVPYYRHEVRLTKPILVYWGILSGWAVFGVNEFGARIVGVLMALASMLGAYYVVSKLRGRQAGLLSAVVVGTVPQFYFIARQAMPDVYLFTSMGCCLLFFCLGLFGPDKRRDLHFLISYVCFALALLAKGPVIIGAVFFATLVIYTAIHIDLRELWRSGRRIELARFLGSGLIATALLAGFTVTAFLFGTSPLWWGYNNEGREAMAQVRAQIQEPFARLRLAEILLVLVILSASAILVQMIRRGRATGRVPLARAAAPAVAALAALGSLVASDPDVRVFLSAMLGIVASGLLLVLSTRRFLSQPWLWPVVQPYFRPVIRQLILFAVVILVVAGPWQLGILLQQGHGYFTDFIIKHNVQRAGETINRSGVSEFYMRVLIFGFYPWSCFIPIALASLVGWWESNPLKRYGLEAYLLIASVITFTAFTTSATKFAHYLSPIIIPVAVLIGLAIDRTIQARHSIASRLAWIVALMLFILPTLDLVDEAGAKYLVGSFTMKRYVPDDMAPGMYYQGLMVAIALIMLMSIFVRSRLLVGGLALSATLMANYTTAYFIPTLSAHKTMKGLCETWRNNAHAGAPICFYGDLKHGIFYYTGYEIERLSRREDFQKFMTPDRQAFCIIERSTFSPLHADFRKRNEGHDLYVADDSHFSYVLISNHPVDP